MDYVYLPFLVHPEKIYQAVQSIRILGIKGVNVTVPHKEKIIRYLDSISEEAKRIGAVNTVLNKNGILTGFNTDYYGFLESVEKHFSIKRKTAFMLGCGGAAKAMLFALLDSGIKTIYISDVEPAKSKELRKRSGSLSNIFVVDSGYIDVVAAECDMLINASPIGMKKGDGSPFNKKAIRPGCFIFDAVYNRKTLLSEYASDKNASYINGLEMLALQGANSFEIWTGIKPPVSFMIKIIREELK